MSNLLHQSLPSDSSDDEDYNPEEDPEFKKDQAASQNPKSLKLQAKIQEKVAKIWVEMKQEIEKGNPSTSNCESNTDVLRLAKEIIRKQNDELNDVKTVIFAGSEYLVDKTGTLRLKTNAQLNEIRNQKKEELGLSSSIINENDANVSLFTNSEANNSIVNESSEILKLNGEKNGTENVKEDYKQRQEYLNKILGKINNKTKVINAVKKSKMDWKQYTKKEQIEDKLEQNRKNGMLQKQNFLLQVKENVKTVNSEMARKKVHI